MLFDTFGTPPWESRRLYTGFGALNDARAVSGVMENVVGILFKNLRCFRGPLRKKDLQLKSREITWKKLESLVVNPPFGASFWAWLPVQVLAGRRRSLLGALQRGAWQVAGPVHHDALQYWVQKINMAMSLGHE